MTPPCLALLLAYQAPVQAQKKLFFWEFFHFKPQLAVFTLYSTQDFSPNAFSTF